MVGLDLLCQGQNSYYIKYLNCWIIRYNIKVNYKMCMIHSNNKVKLVLTQDFRKEPFYGPRIF